MSELRIMSSFKYHRILTCVFSLGWFQSNKLISATFQLARKLAPSVVFIDEMDAFLSQRDGTEGSAVNSMKSEFLTLWDGLLSERKAEGGASPLLPTPPIIVLGCTNRPYDVDPAILRRLPRAFEVPLPNLQSRMQLLRLFLERQSMTKQAKDFLPTVAERTEGYSGSDLKEVCRAAAWEPVREMTTGASRSAAGCESSKSAPALRRTSSGFPPRGTKARPVNERDFLLALAKVKKTGESARTFHKQEFLRAREERASMAAEVSKATSGGKSARAKGEGRRSNSVQEMDLQQIMAMAMAAAASMTSGGGSSPGRRSRPSSFDAEEEGSDSDPPEIIEE